MRSLPLLCVAASLTWALPAIADPAAPSVRRSATCKPPKPAKKDEPAVAAATKKKKHEPEEAPSDEKPTPPTAPPPAAKGSGEEEGRTLQRGERVEFDSRLIQGQTAKAGAVYLFARVPTNLKSMVRERTTFREKIIRTVYPIEEELP